jgi:transitional endoplasmic reticulum ATPase
MNMTKQKMQATESNAVEIVQEGEKLVLPKQMSLESAISLLNRRMEYDSKRIVMEETFDVFPLDGACALDTVLQRRYGWAPATSTPGFFRENPPQLISVAVGPGQVRQVPWGAFLLPNVDGRLQTSIGHKDGRIVFQLRADILRRDESTIRALFDDVRSETHRSSIYRGKTVRLRFFDANGDKLEMPEPQFLENEIDEAALVYPEAVQRAIHTNLFVPIMRAHDCIANGIPLKRGVLLGGTFGTGKTLAAAAAAKLAEKCGLTCVYVPRAEELAEALVFARQYQSPACVVFCEDIDRATSGPRSTEMDDILNSVDGIDSKNCNIILVLTTNAIEKIHPAMLRPGRLDAVIEVTPPDGPAVEKLVRLYGGSAISASADLRPVGHALAGHIPAVIAEVVQRAKLAQLAMQAPGTQVEELSVPALLEAAQSISAQVRLLQELQAPSDEVKDGGFEGVLARSLREALNGDHELLEDVSRRVRRIANRVAA